MEEQTSGTITVQLYQLPDLGFPETLEAWHAALKLADNQVVERAERIDYHDERGEVIEVSWTEQPVEDQPDEVVPEQPEKDA